MLSTKVQTYTTGLQVTTLVTHHDYEYRQWPYAATWCTVNVGKIRQRHMCVCVCVCVRRSCAASALLHHDVQNLACPINCLDYGFPGGELLDVVHSQCLLHRVRLGRVFLYLNVAAHLSVHLDGERHSGLHQQRLVIFWPGLIRQRLLVAAALPQLLRNVRRVRGQHQDERLQGGPRPGVPLGGRVEELHHGRDGGVEPHFRGVIRHLLDHGGSNLQLLGACIHILDSVGQQPPRAR
mmetsp:Transcript_32482/g.81387  ORF Transcript_32482/g.81387 Transcript_32482/m.81387 type:complete len:237 (+) Transcript_32482:293-1003(+)